MIVHIKAEFIIDEMHYTTYHELNTHIAELGLIDFLVHSDKVSESYEVVSIGDEEPKQERSDNEVT